MARATKITFDEWAAELERASRHVASDDGLTAEELCCHLAKSPGTVRRILKALHAEGRVVVGRRSIRTLDGRMLPVPVYKIKKKGGQ